ncbi:DUF6177 family protein [Streptomyces sp. NPDC021356]|uniref:DUF6177 family protein n=1 Tax=Streptomyces sp. NPDC021356 TaxID=3154900 RepID=UPI0033EFA613
MTQETVAITRRMPDPASLLAALHAGGPDLRVARAGQGAVARLCTEDGRLVVSVEAPRYIQVPGETARLLGPGAATDTPVWWTEVRAASAAPEAPRLAASVAGRLATLLDGTTGPREAASHTDVVTVSASGEPSPDGAGGDDVLAEADILTDQAVIVLHDAPILAATTWLTELLRTTARTGRYLYLVTPPTTRLTLPTRTLLDRAPARWVVSAPETGYYDGLSGVELDWHDGHFTPTTGPSPAIVDAYRPPSGPAGERQLLLSMRTVHAPDEQLLLGGALECAWQTLTGEPPAGWSTAEPVNVPWSRRQLTDLVRSRARRGSPTWLVAVGNPDHPAIATQRVTHTRLGVEEHITLAFGHTADSPALLDRLPHLAEELAAQHRLATMITELRAARADLTVPSHYEPPALPVSLTFGPDAVADIGRGCLDSTLPDTPSRRLGPTARPALHYELGDGTDPGAWRRLRHIEDHLNSTPGARAGS